ncbi:hypothetical protein QTP88_006990 [Uroleucon formosanum]
MDTFIIKKRKLDEDEISSNLNIESTSGESNQASSSSTGLNKIRLYNISYLAMGFTWYGNENCPQPECIVCGVKLSNAAMAPSKLKRHLLTKHNHLANKNIDYFKQLLSSQNKESAIFEKKVTIPNKALEASYKVAELIVENKKPHTIVESLILPACSEIVRIMFGSEAEAEIQKIPLSNNTIRRHVQDMSEDIEKNVGEKIKASNGFYLQIDESTDTNGKCYLIGFIRFINNDNIIEQFFCCKEMKETTTGLDAFHIIDSYLKLLNLSWESCFGICTDGAPKALVAKTIGPQLKNVLDDVVKMVNFIKMRPLKSRLFSLLCEAMESQFTKLILHTEVRWLSRGKVLSRVHELKDELIVFFTLEDVPEFCELLTNEKWLAKLSYLSDIFSHLNQINSSMQRPNENILTSCSKLFTLKDKLKIWKKRVQKNQFEMFPSLSVTQESSEVMKFVVEHLTALEESLDKYFPDLDISEYDWINDPFDKNISLTEFNLEEEEELAEIRNNRTLLSKYKNVPLNEFWIHVEKIHDKIGKKALKILLQFSTSYLCEQ